MRPQPFRSTVESGRARISSTLPVVVIGAGPYGLAIAAHLNEASIPVRVFGEPMETWARHMPEGMLLRSRWEASQIADPRHALGLAQFEQVVSAPSAEPVPLQHFCDYGQWFQREAVSQLERRQIRGVSRTGDGSFTIEVQGGEIFQASRVIVAAGIIPFAYRPTQFKQLPHDLVSHSADHSNIGRFRGKRVIVVGGGQSAIESAALLTENGADVELIIRSQTINWLPVSDKKLVESKPLRHYAYRRIALGNWPVSWLVALADVWPAIPLKKRFKSARSIIRPAAAGWLKSRIGTVKLTTGKTIIAVNGAENEITLRLEDGSTRSADHVLLATGFRIDISRYTFLSAELLRQVQSWNGYPLLHSGLESSVPGLFFLGSPAMATFGPVMCFVCGTWTSARAVTRKISGQKLPRGGFSW